MNKDFQHVLTSPERGKHQDKHTRGSSTVDLRSKIQLLSTSNNTVDRSVSNVARPNIQWFN